MVCGHHRHNAIVTKLGRANHVIIPSHGHLVSVLSLTPAPIVFSSFVGNYIYEVTHLIVNAVSLEDKMILIRAKLCTCRSGSTIRTLYVHVHVFCIVLHYCKSGNFHCLSIFIVVRVYKNKFHEKFCVQQILNYRNVSFNK